MAEQQGLESLEAWKVSRELAVDVCKQVLPMLPREEKYALSSQLRRAVQSVPANIAEAFGRFHFADAVRFCYVARGSLEEVWSHLLLAHDLGYLSDEDLGKYRATYRRLSQLINGYIRYLREQGATHDPR